MRVVSAGHGLTNEWCRRPAPDVPAHSSTTTWLAGDNLFGTHVLITYKLANGDEIRFTTSVRFPSGGSEAGCEFVHVERSSPRYDCEASVDAGVRSKDAEVSVRVFPVARVAGRIGKVQR